MSIEIEPLTPVIGAEILGANLSKLTDSGFTDIFQAFTDHSVIFFRDQPQLTTEQHTAFAKRFGEIHVPPYARGKETRHPGLINIRINSKSEVAAGNRWHSDISCDAEPPQASILQLHTIPTLGGDTLFSSMYAAYAALSERMKEYLDGLTAKHSGEETYGHLFKIKNPDGWPENDHPIVRKHVDSGRPALYVNREYTRSINDVPREEGRSMLNFLFDHAERVAFQCRFRWSKNAVAIWDNRCALHHAMWDYWPAERLGQRISVKGEAPVAWKLHEDVAPASGETVVKLTR